MAAKKDKKENAKKGNLAVRIIKKIVKYTLILLILLIIAAIAIPYFFKDQILAVVKEQANENLNATVDFKDVDLSLIWTFPNFSFSVDELSVTGKDEFEGIKLADIKKFSFRLDLWSVFSGKYKVKGIVLDNPKLYVKVLKNGKANYDIAKTDENATTEEPKTEEKKDESSGGGLDLRLSYYAINNADIIYDDAPGDMYVEVKNLTHTGSGDFMANLYNVYTQTNIDELTVSTGGIPYLKKTKVDIDFDVKVDLDKMKFTLLDNSFQFNALKLNAEGEVEMPDDKIKMDLKFNAPTTSFASVLSMIPSAYTKDFSSVKTNGKFSFAGYAKGTYVGDSYPAFGLDLTVDNADFQYPDLPMGVKDIALALAVRSPSSDLDKMVIDLSKFHMKLGANPFDARLLLRTPMSDPDIDTEIKGKIDLAELAKAFPMEDVKQLDGIIEANLTAKTRMSFVELEQYDRVDMQGLLGITNMNYNAAGLPPVKLNEVKMDFTPNMVNLENFDLKIGKSDIQADGKLDNILTYFSRDKVMRGILNVRSQYLDADELSGGSEEEAEATDPAASEATVATDMVDTTSVAEGEMFDRFEFFANADFEKIKYDVYEINKLNAKGSFSPSTAALDNLSFDIGKVDIQANGRIDNVFGYLFDGDLLKGNLALNSNYMNLNQFMTEDGTATEPTPSSDTGDNSGGGTTDSEAVEPIEIPANIDFHFSSKFGELIYDTYNLKNAKAELHVHDQILDVIELSANIFGGRVELNGEYNAQDPKKPTFAFGYDMIDIDFQETAKTAGIVQDLLPIFKSIHGKFSSDFRLKGVLGEDLSPDMKTLFADGTLRTFDAVIKDYPPLAKLSNKLKMKDMSEVVLQNTKNFFKLEDGRVAFQRFVNEYKGIGMTLGGSHGLDNTLDYDLVLRVPRKLLASNPVGAAANNAVNSGLSMFNKQAEKLGININQSEFLNIGVDITGDMDDPKYKVKLLGGENGNGETVGDQLKNTLKDEMEKVKAETEAKAKEEIEKIKSEAEAKAKAEADRLKKEAEERAAKLKAEAEARAKAQAEKLAQQSGINADSLKNQVGDKIGDKLGDKVGGILGGGNNDGNGGGNKWTPPWKKKKKNN